MALTLLDRIRTPPALAFQMLTVVETPRSSKQPWPATSPGPLASTSGQLDSIDHTLLHLAVDQQIHLRRSGDLDGSGLRITESVARTDRTELVAVNAPTVRHAHLNPQQPRPDRLLKQHRTPRGTPCAQARRDVVFQAHDAVLHQELDPPKAGK
ncbi:DUF2399 domain-containing protein [Streptantibioticus rubrisoli]|uniref:DUF2399 domain-containing protein n=1 Tax=Streptantibioticus rubrisoli TaxID=1387313 RepID=A0ABT1PJR0_9ACTN|nr:DUF2399 domain-containing protein [Streptantibioticus rubrisoli]MCQ4044748.1 DUF2399 domain-containing protein [Streptantibioticus rubrisoli]